MKKKHLGFLALTLALALLAGCAPAQSEAGASGAIKIAYVGPLTGDNAEYGQTMSNAVQIAIDDINAQGDVLGRKLELVSFDDKNDATEATTVAEKVCSDKDVIGVIGHFSSGVALAAAEVYQENGMPYIAISAAHPQLTDGDFIFRNNALYDTEASSMLQIMADKGVSKFGILVPNSDAGVSVTTEINNWLDKFGDGYAPELVTKQMFDDGATDLNAQVQEMIAAGCEAVYTNAAYAQAVPFMTQYRVYDADVQFVVSAACFSPTFLDAAGEYAEGVVLATSFFYGSTNPAVKEFVDKYVGKYNSNPSNFCGQSYDAAFSFYHALLGANKAERTAVRDALFNVEFEGLTGMMRYNEHGECLKQQTLVGVKNGEWVEFPNVLKSAGDYLESISK